MAGADLAIDLGPDLAPLVCDLGPSGDAGAGGRLYLAGVSTGGTLYAAAFQPSGGWSALGASGSSTLAGVSVIAAGSPAEPLIAARQSDNALLQASFEPCLQGFRPLAAPFAAASTSNRPALAAGASGADLIFKGGINNDQRLYHSHLGAGGWSAAVAQTSFLTALSPTAIEVAGALHALFAGTDNKLYDGTVSDGASGGAATPVYDVNGTTALSNLAPAAVVGLDGTAYVVFTGTDTNLYWTSEGAGGAYGKPAQLCAGIASCLMTSDQSPVVSLDATGAPIVAFHGTDGHIYTSTLTLGNSPIWTAAIPATQATETTDLQPAIAPGLGLAKAELVYVRHGDGVPRHARLIAGAWSDGGTLSTALAAAPALVTLP